MDLSYIGFELLWNGVVGSLLNEALKK